MKTHCAKCQKEFDKKPSELKKSKSGNSFCSKSCANGFNNTIFIKRTPSNRCACGKKIHRSGKQCQKCYLTTYQLDNKTLFEATGHRKGPHKYINIRKAARRIYIKAGKPCRCIVCGYAKHFEVAHVKSIASFNQDTLVSQINSPSNLAALCPNHHWELDHSLLDSPGWSRTIVSAL